MKFQEITEKIIIAGLKVLSAIGPGVLESVYKTCLAVVHDWKRYLAKHCHAGLRLDSGFRIDLLVEDLVIVELKCVETLLPIHKAQLLTYLRLMSSTCVMASNEP